MARNFKPIETELFKEKVLKLFDENKDGDYDLLNETILKDLSKVYFDFENISHPTDKDGFWSYPNGFRKFPNGLNLCFLSAGGDWEQPVCFIIYWDGKKLRGYVPTEGNGFDKKGKCSWGNDDGRGVGDFDEAEVEKEISEEAMIKDIVNRIQAL